MTFPFEILIQITPTLYFIFLLLLVALNQQVFYILYIFFREYASWCTFLIFHVKIYCFSFFTSNFFPLLLLLLMFLSLSFCFTSLLLPFIRTFRCMLLITHIENWISMKFRMKEMHRNLRSFCALYNMRFMLKGRAVEINCKGEAR